MSPRRITPKYARQKGLAYQAEIAKRWRDSGLFPQAQSGIAQVRKGSEQPDITNAGQYWHELKHNKAIAPLAALRQAEKNVEAWRKSNAVDIAWRAVAVCRQNHQGDTVMMRLETYEWLVSLAQAVQAKEVEA